MSCSTTNNLLHHLEIANIARPRREHAGTRDPLHRRASNGALSGSRVRVAHVGREFRQARGGAA
jgi:hypothetical protein